MAKTVVKNMTKEELRREVYRLRRAFAKWERIVDWDHMARNYHPNVADANFGKRPKEPRRWWPYN